MTSAIRSEGRAWPAERREGFQTKKRTQAKVLRWEGGAQQRPESDREWVGCHWGSGRECGGCMCRSSHTAAPLGCGGPWKDGCQDGEESWFRGMRDIRILLHASIARWRKQDSRILFYWESGLESSYSPLGSLSWLYLYVLLACIPQVLLTLLLCLTPISAGFSWHPGRSGECCWLP